MAYDTCQPYLACSSNSSWGFCKHINTTCHAENICRTCERRFVAFGESICQEINHIPNATIAEYGTIRLKQDSVHQIKAEIFARGPVAAGVNGKPLHEYHGGIFHNATEDKKNTHLVSIVGWGVDKESRDEYWIVRNR